MKSKIRNWQLDDEADVRAVEDSNFIFSAVIIGLCVVLVAGLLWSATSLFGI